ncbi:MAG: hypothetical protein JW922_09465 [Paludibacteraceae bacterium]|nr:hypothetical protein [Paludibacteraceae bacterium]
MTILLIKIIAIITMTVDHIGLFLFPTMPSLRLIGRFSFPFFAWLIASGEQHTKNVKKYAMRLLLFGLISQIPYALLFADFPHAIFSKLNIMFTLLLGLISIQLYKAVAKKSKYLAFLFVVLVAVFGEVNNVSYGAAGVLSIALFYIYFNNKLMMWLTQTMIFVAYYWVPIAYGIIMFSSLYADQLLGLVQPFAVLSILVINSYNGKQGKPIKLFFYLFYPLHLLVIYLIKVSVLNLWLF